MSIKLSVVDQSPVHGSHAPAEALNLTVELAQICDELGYHRYWVAEHHDSVHFASPCPEIMVAKVASVTRRIRVGSGGVMLSHYSPLEEVQNRYNGFSPALKANYDKILSGYTVGTPEQCAEEISALGKDFGCDEISTVTVTHSQEDRVDSYRQLMKGF